MKKLPIEQVLIVSAGVLIAGYLLNMLRGNSLADSSRSGFTS